jgi:hypothetical protein
MKTHEDATLIESDATLRELPEPVTLREADATQQYYAPGMLERIDFLVNALQDIAQYQKNRLIGGRGKMFKRFERDTYVQDIESAVELLRLRKERKHTQVDSIFMSNTEDLLKQRNDNNVEGLPNYYVVGGLSGLIGFVLAGGSFLGFLVCAWAGCIIKFFSKKDTSDIDSQIAGACAFYRINQEDDVL